MLTEWVTAEMRIIVKRDRPGVAFTVKRVPMPTLAGIEEMTGRVASAPDAL